MRSSKFRSGSSLLLVRDAFSKAFGVKRLPLTQTPLSLFAPDPSSILALAFGTGEGPLVYGRRFLRHSVQKTAFYGTEEIFGAQNSLLWYATHLQRPTEQLMPKYGNTFSKRNLDYFRQFYLCFNDLEIVNTRVHNLTWSHFRSIIQVADPKAREWYVKEASEQMWSVRTLNRNIGTQYYGRRMACVREGLALPSPDIETNDPLEYIKRPVKNFFLAGLRDLIVIGILSDY